MCHYEQSPASNETSIKQNSSFSANTKRIYLLIIVIFRVAIPFVLLLTVNIVLFVSVRKTREESSKLSSSLLTRHGQHRRVTPMIFFSSCILLLTVSPRYNKIIFLISNFTFCFLTIFFRYLLQFYLNFYGKDPSCILTHFASHILKSLELSNYTFNVLVSIVSGKHGRNELFDMLLCRSISPQNARNINGSKLMPVSSAPSLSSSKPTYPQRFNYRHDENNDQTGRQLMLPTNQRHKRTDSMNSHHRYR